MNNPAVLKFVLLLLCFNAALAFTKGADEASIIPNSPSCLRYLYHVVGHASSTAAKQANNDTLAVKEYQELANQAEMAILNKDYALAAQRYDSAFALNCEKRSDDLYNALIVAQKAQQYDLTYFTAQQLLQRGMCISFLPALGVKGIDSSRMQVLQNTAKRHKPTVPGYRERLNRLLDEDQNIRAGDPVQHLVRELDSLNYLEFRALVNRYGFPNAERMGLACSSSGRGIAPPPWDILLHHFAKNRFEGMAELLESALDSNYLHPVAYMNYARYLTNIKYVPDPLIRMGDSFYVDRFSEEEKKKINDNRAAIGAASLEEHIAKIKYRIQNRDSVFRLQTLIYQYPKLPEAEIEADYIELQIEPATGNR